MFYVNVPIAVVILVLAVRLLPAPRPVDRPVIDYLGIAFVSAGSATLILATSWGGTEYAWDSAVIIGLFVASALLLALFVYAESRAVDPLLPLRLFRRNVFSVCVVLAFIVGFALLGAITFLPTYLQYCQGVSATESGLRTLPLVAGLLVASTSSGNVVSRTGVYRPFPIVGSLVLGAGMFLLSRLDEFSGFWTTSLAMVVFGVGVGLTMQVLTIIVQGTAEYRDLGVATSGVTFFRTMGSAFGAAIFGTIYVSALNPRLAAAIASAGVTEAQATNPAHVTALPAAQRAPIVHAYAEAVQTVFLYAIPVALLAFVVALFLRQTPLRGLARPGATDVGKGFGIPDQRSSAQQLEGQVVRILRSRFSRGGARADPAVGHRPRRGPALDRAAGRDPAGPRWFRRPVGDRPRTTHAGRGDPARDRRRRRDRAAGGGVGGADPHPARLRGLPRRGGGLHRVVDRSARGRQRGAA